MASYAQLIAAMEAVIKENGQKEITGVLLQNTLRSMIQELGAKCQFGGVAEPSTNPGTPDYNVAYIAGEGVYPNFGGATVFTGYIGIFSNTGSGGSWELTQIELLTNGSITTLMLANDAVTTAKIANNAVTSDKVAENAIQTLHISNNAVTNSKIANNAVTENKIVGGAVTESKIADDAVTTNKIKNKNVTREKLSDELNDELDNKADIDGFYSTLGAGVAENLVGRGSVPAEYTFRTSGGDADLGSGTAQIKRLMGRTLVLNQIGFPLQGNNESIVIDPTQTISRTITITHNDTTGASTLFYSGINMTVGHKYCLAFTANADEQVTLSIGWNNYTNTKEWLLTTNKQRCNVLINYLQDTYGARAFFGLSSHNTSGIEIKLDDIICIDLTLMFGAGNEPSTVAEFEALFPLGYYAYNAGELLSVKATGIKTNGFNQLKEQPINKENAEFPTLDISKYTRVFGGIDYFVSFPVFTTSWRLGIKAFDLSGNEIIDELLDDSGFYYNGYHNCWLQGADGTAHDFTIQFAKDCYIYLCFVAGTVTPSTQIPETCLNISWRGYRNGEYEPYWENELPIPITTMTGKLNGAGASVAMFANGLKSAGSAFDEILSTKAIKRTQKVVFDGTEDWQTIGGYYFYLPTIQGLNDESQKPICNIYLGQMGSNGFPDDKYIKLLNGDWGLAVTDSNFATVEAFKAHLASLYANGTPMAVIYPIASPEEYVLDAEQQMNYRVDDFGTEMELPQNDDEPVTAPIRYEVQYAMNAVDTLRRLPENYISKESFADFLAEFDSKVGAAIGATIVSTMTFNAETQKYGFTITITPNNP